eukprot:253876-Amphidinium_carterae.1
MDPLVAFKEKVEAEHKTESGKVKIELEKEAIKKKKVVIDLMSEKFVQWKKASTLLTYTGVANGAKKSILTVDPQQLQESCTSLQKAFMKWGKPKFKHFTI